MARELGNTTYYNPKEVAIVIDRHYETALGRIKEGQIKSEKINNGYLVSHENLVDYLENELSLPETTIDLRLKKMPVNNVANSNQ